jgi:hypothetical protein
VGDCEWSKQMRYYWNVDADTCHVKMSSSTFIYGYEFLGCSSRLVITPLTDRLLVQCNLTSVVLQSGRPGQGKQGLSRISQRTIKNAKDVKASKFMFEGRDIRVIDTCTAFITMV